MFGKIRNHSALNQQQKNIKMNDYTRLIALFGYETDGGRNSVLWQTPQYFSNPGGQAGKELDEKFGEWKAQKRPITFEEVVSGRWIKQGDHGYSFEVQF